MNGESFHRFAAALGLTENALDALIEGGEPPVIEDRDHGLAYVRFARSESVPGCEGVPVLVKKSTMIKWMRELHRLRNEGKR